MLLGHHHLEIGRGLMLRFALTGSPFHEEAIAEPAEHAHDPDLTQEQGPLLGQGKTDLFAAEGVGPNRAAFVPSFIDLLGAGLGGSGRLRGENWLGTVTAVSTASPPPPCLGSLPSSTIRSSLGGRPRICSWIARMAAST